MPWTMLGTMHEEDLKAIFAYLKTVPRLEMKLQNIRLLHPNKLVPLKAKINYKKFLSRYS
jgi:hypothetical protein